MTDQTAPSPEPDLTRLLADLVAVLKADAELRSAQLARLDAMIDLHAQTAAKTAVVGTEALRQDMDLEVEAERQRTRRAKWYTAVFGLLAVIVGAVLFYWIFQMVEDMNRMEDYMYNMGHSANDDRAIHRTERKTAGASFMLSMADDMGQMKADMGDMRIAMARMDGSMGAMIKDIGTMSGDMGTLSQDITTMSATMALLRYDTALLRVGVGGISNDTRAMGVPFRAMDSIMPW